MRNLLVAITFLVGLNALAQGDIHYRLRPRSMTAETTETNANSRGRRIMKISRAKSRGLYEDDVSQEIALCRL